MVGLALEGGGAKGAYQAGAYMALKKCGVRIDAVAGTSIGSFNGALIASHEEKKMLELWRDATMSELLGIDDSKAHEILSENFSFQKIKTSFTELYKILKNKGLDISNYRALVRNSVNERKLRKSDIRYGLTTLKVENFEPIDIFLEDIPEDKLHDYIVASSYFPIFKKEKLIDNGFYLDGGLYNLSPSDMLEKIGCDLIYVINIRGLGFRKPRFRSRTKIVEIKPKKSLGSIIVFDKVSVEENITRGYLDVMRLFEKVDGIEYYFNRRSDWYYRRLNHNISKKLYNAASALLHSKDEKETVLKALEYVLMKEKKDDLIKYRHKTAIGLAKLKNDDNIIYQYASKLKIW